MKKFSVLCSVLLVCLLALPLDAWAQFGGSAGSVGNSLLNDVQGLISGRLGTVIGLGISLFGLWMWLAQQSSWGLLIVIGGAALTAFPGLYGSLAGAFKDAFSSTGARGSATSGGGGGLPGFGGPR